MGVWSNFYNRAHGIRLEVEHSDDNATETDPLQHRRPTIHPSPCRRGPPRPYPVPAGRPSANSPSSPPSTAPHCRRSTPRFASCAGLARSLAEQGPLTGPSKKGIDVGRPLGLASTGGGHRRRGSGSRRLKADVDPLACPRRSPVAQAAGRWRLASRVEPNASGQRKKDPQDGMASRRPTRRGCTVLKRRWVVERIWAGWMHVRRQARDYEVLIRPSETGI